MFYLSCLNQFEPKLVFFSFTGNFGKTKSLFVVAMKQNLETYQVTKKLSREKYFTYAAVSIIVIFKDVSKHLIGVVRFIQLDDLQFDLVSLKSGHYSNNICEFGDITKGCETKDVNFL
jgi:hypothetical protein